MAQFRVTDRNILACKAIVLFCLRDPVVVLGVNGEFEIDDKELANPSVAREIDYQSRGKFTRVVA